MLPKESFSAGSVSTKYCLVKKKLGAEWPEGKLNAIAVWERLDWNLAAIGTMFKNTCPLT